MTHSHLFPRWPFSDPINTASFTTRQVLERDAPILEVYHDHEGDWQFLCGTTSEIEDLKLVCMGCMMEIDPGLLELSDLPVGWCAIRKSAADTWEREAFEQEEEDDAENAEAGR